MRIIPVLSLLTVIFITLTLSSQAALALGVENVRFGQHPDKVRMVVEMDRAADFRAFILDGPPRLVIDLPAYDWRVGNIQSAGVTAIKTVRQGPLQADTGRIVVDLAQPHVIRGAFILPGNGGSHDRLVVDFVPASARDFAAAQGRIFGDFAPGDAAAAAPSPAKAGPAVPRPASKPAAAGKPSAPQAAAHNDIIPDRKPAEAAFAARKPVLVIDAGHGGMDPGAIGTNGVFEKHITLAMARELRDMLQATGKYDTHLTRDSDKFLRLYQRVDIARAKNADLFISIHADTIGKSNVRGMSIYTLSEKASDAQTARLAEQENKVDLIAGADLSHADKDVANILVDLAMRDTMNQSKFFANTVVVRAQGDGLRLLESPHRYAGFAVLKAPDVPSVLVELGFMSNPAEARQLNDPAYRRRLGTALLKGIDAYFEQMRRNSRM